MLSVGGKELETDNSGYLKNHEEWCESVAEQLAAQEALLRLHRQSADNGNH